MRGAHRGFTGGCGRVVCLAREIRDIHKASRHFVAASRHAHAVLEDRSERASVEWPQIFFFGKRAKPARIFGDNRVVHRHLFVKLHAHFENFAEVLFVIVKKFVHFAVADQDHFHIDLDGFRLHRAATKWVKHFERLDFQPIVVQGAFQGAPNSRLGNGFHRIHNEVTAVGPQQRSAPQIHKIAGPAAAGVISALNGSKQIGVSRRRFKDDR